MDIVFSITITKDSFLNDTNINALNQAFFTLIHWRKLLIDSSSILCIKDSHDLVTLLVGIYPSNIFLLCV